MLVNEYIQFIESELLDCFLPDDIEQLYKSALWCDKYVNTPMSGFHFDRFIDRINNQSCTCEACNDVKDFASTLDKKQFILAK